MTFLRHLSLTLLIAMAMSSLPQARAADAPLQPYTAHYDVLRNGKLLGRGTVTLRATAAGRWELNSAIQGTEGLAGLSGVEITERSELTWFEGRPESLSYDYRQQAAWRARERSVRFDPAGGSILSRDRDGEHRFAWEHGVLDRQSVVLALAQDLRAGKRGELSYTVVDRDEFGPQRYRVAAEEQVDTPAGRLRALRVDRLRADARGRTTTSWLGLEQQFLPVRVLQNEADGDSIELRLVSLHTAS